KFRLARQLSRLLFSHKFDLGIRALGCDDVVAEFDRIVEAGPKLVTFVVLLRVDRVDQANGDLRTGRQLPARRLRNHSAENPLAYARLLELDNFDGVGRELPWLPVQQINNEVLAKARFHQLNNRGACSW